MPTFGPITRQELIRCLRQLGFDGPYAGGKHEYMERGEFKLRIPNPHQKKDIGVPLLNRLLKEAEISREEWEDLD